MNGPEDWDAEKEYKVGYDQAIKRIEFHLFWVHESHGEWRKEMEEAYIKGYQAGRKQLLINLIKEDPK